MAQDVQPHTTPAKRVRRAREPQYFDVGKIGRRTGITLPDTGIRDEHGLEPVSGIFSSPVLDGSDDILEDAPAGLDDSVSDTGATSLSRGRPRPPAVRASTPKTTNIASSKRISSTKQGTGSSGSEDELSPAQSRTQPPPNRRLDFTGKKSQGRKSLAFLDAQSPFRPKKKLRRSVGPIYEDQLSNDVQARDSQTEMIGGNVDEEDPVEQSIEVEEFDDEDLMAQDGLSEVAANEQSLTNVEEPQTTEAHVMNGGDGEEMAEPREPQSPYQRQYTPPTAIIAPSSSSRKRGSDGNRNADSDVDISMERAEQAAQPPRRKRGRPPNIVQTTASHSDGFIDPSLLIRTDEDAGPSHDDSAAIREQIQSEIEAEVPRTKAKRKGKERAHDMPKERDPNRAMRKSQTSPVDNETGPSSSKTPGAGPSNVHLRASTPFEDAGHRTSRSGRNLIKPLKYWENEGVIWNRGSIEGIVRADPVVKPEKRTNRRRKRKGRKKGSGLDDIQEEGDESDAESIMPDEWETTHGVISGMVAKWNPQIKAGDPDDPVEEDIVFAASSIITRDVLAADFKFAKIMTTPFFGAGLIEIPPKGVKRTKNSRNMQILFFVHEGKVLVEVGANGLEVNQFALTKGGCWSVPRGNNYAIMNESRTRWAKVFFAQGCDVSEN